MSEGYRALQHTIFTEHVMPCRAYLVTSTKINLMPPEGKITWDLFFKKLSRGTEASIYLQEKEIVLEGGGQT